MPAGMKLCAQPGCPEILPPKTSRCPAHARQSATARGYTSKGHQRFRRKVLARDPMCVLCHRSPSVVADHFPIGRAALIATGFDPNDPARGRGLCRSCHSRATLEDHGGFLPDRDSY